MAKIIKNYTLEVLKPVSEEMLIKMKKMKQKNNSMKIYPGDIMKLYIGTGLIPLVEKELENNLIERISTMRSRIARETGVIIPTIRILDDTNLKPFEYSFYLRNIKRIQYEIKRNKYICLENEKQNIKIKGKEILDPVFGLSALLINKNQIEEANKAGYSIFDASCIIMASISNIIEENLVEIFTYGQSKNILNLVAENNSTLVSDCYLKYKHIEIKKILEKILEKKKNLLNIDKILEALLLYEDEKKDIEIISELIINKI